MPAIKKKWIKANQEVKEAESNENNDEFPGDEDRDQVGRDASLKASAKGALSSPAKPKKRSVDPLMLRGLDGEVLQEKRKRFIPPAEAKLEEWLDCHLEKRNDVTLSLIQLYKYYTELCQGVASEIMDTPAFNRMIKKKFGKTFGIKDSSVYKSVLKERNLNQKKAAGVKLKEIAHEAINHFGNPWNGVRFFSLKQYVGTKYPFLKIDQRPKILKRILEMGVGYGQIDLVKGIGMAGFYRLPGAEPPKPKLKQDKDGGKGDSKAEEADSAGSADAEEPNEKEDSAKSGKKAETGAAGKDEQTDKPKEVKPKKLEKCNLKRVPHGNPKKIEDTFPLAITFQSAPKTASIVKIRRYIQDHYQMILGDSRWRKAVEGGAEKGHWEYISGSGITGRLHLLMDDFDPDSEHVQDQICAAIIACHEPKAASGNQIKKYISRYHPDFNVDSKPDRFKKALIRAAERSMIVQLSGLGANGSFELRDVFVPSPRILSGEDASSDEEENSDGSELEPVYVPKGTKSRGSPQKKPIKRQEVVRKPPVAVKKAAPVRKPVKKEPVGKAKRKSVAGKATANKGGKKLSPVKAKSEKKGRQSRFEDSDDEEEEEEEAEEPEEPEYTPRKSQSRGGPAITPSSNKKAQKSKKSKSSEKTGRQQKRAPSPSEDEEEFDDELPENTPQKSPSRGRSATSLGKEPKTSSKKTENKSSRASPASPAKKKVQRTQVKGGGSITTLNTSFPIEESDGGDADSEPEYTPRKSSSRGGSLSPSKTKRKK